MLGPRMHPPTLVGGGGGGGGGGSGWQLQKSHYFKSLVATTGSVDNAKGVSLALSSSLFIGLSFILLKKGQILAGQSGTRASAGGYSYLRQPLWWIGMLTMIGGESANFAAYAYAPAILVTPLGAATIVASAVFARCFLGESLHCCGGLGIALCIYGSIVLVRFAPEEVELMSVEEVFELASQPQFALYACAVVAFALTLVYHYAPRYGKSNVHVYVLICSLVGSLSVVSLKALGIAVKLTLRGSNQFSKHGTYLLVGVCALCIATQMNFLNRALDTFNTTMVTSVYYVYFTVSTVAASTIMYKDWENQTGAAICWQLFALLVLVFGVHVLSSTKDSPAGCAAGMQSVLGRAQKPEYQLCAVDEEQRLVDDADCPSSPLNSSGDEKPSRK